MISSGEAERAGQNLAIMGYLGILRDPYSGSGQRVLAGSGVPIGILSCDLSLKHFGKKSRGRIPGMNAGSRDPDSGPCQSRFGIPMPIIRDP